MLQEWFETIRVPSKYHDLGIVMFRDGIASNRGGSTSVVYLRDNGSYLVKTLFVADALDGEVNLFYTSCNSLEEVFCALINHSGWDESYKARAYLKNLKQEQDPAWVPTPENLSRLRLHCKDFG